MTSLPSLTRFIANSYWRATTLLSNGSRDSMSKYFAMSVSYISTEAIAIDGIRGSEVKVQTLVDRPAARYPNRAGVIR